MIEQTSALGDKQPKLERIDKEISNFISIWRATADFE